MSVQRAMALIQGKQSVNKSNFVFYINEEIIYNVILCYSPFIEDSVSETPESTAQASPEIQERLRKQLNREYKRRKGDDILFFFILDIV